MKLYETQLMIQKAGREPARLGFLDVLADSEQEALDIAKAEGLKAYESSCALIGRRNETTRIWAELVSQPTT
ncbi:MAG: hypothetical protein J6A26_01820 [Oscillospiraceae bacterium]|nr:hypothetical protein [Oscillospiraceae bacterium]